MKWLKNEDDNEELDVLSWWFCLSSSSGRKEESVGDGRMAEDENDEEGEKVCLSASDMRGIAQGGSSWVMVYYFIPHRERCTVSL